MKVRSYFAKLLDGMARGLFASLIIGVIIKQIGDYTGIAALQTFGQITQYMMGPAIGAGIAISRKAPTFTLIAALAAGAIGAGAVRYMDASALWSIRIGEPVGALCAAWVGVEIGRLIEGRTKFDLLVVPAAVVLAATLVGLYISPPVSNFMTFLGQQVNRLTDLHPAPMGILLGIVVGMILTLPISSAALCISISIGGLAGGAACAGCCAQMVGFAVMSFRENKWSGLLSQGVGTSMLQVPNIIKNPLIWIPPTIASGICGILSTTFKMETNATGAGMGTSGLVGPLMTFSAMDGQNNALLLIILIQVLLPAAVSLVLCEVMRKKGWIKFGDLRI